MKIILPLAAILSLMLSACAGVAVPSGMEFGTNVGAPTPCGTPTAQAALATNAGEASTTTGGTGVSGSGTGIDLTVSPEMLLTSEAAFATANRTGPTEVSPATPGPSLPPGTEQVAPNLLTASPTASPTPTSTAYLSPNNAPTEPGLPVNPAPSPCG